MKVRAQVLFIAVSPEISKAPAARLALMHGGCTEAPPNDFVSSDCLVLCYLCVQSTCWTCTEEMEYQNAFGLKLCAYSYTISKFICAHTRYI